MDTQTANDLEVAAAQVLTQVCDSQAQCFARDGAYERKAVAPKAIDGEGSFSYAVSHYKGPRGIGYLVRFHFEQDGKQWIRTENVGPESERRVTWRELKEMNFGRSK